MKRSSVIDLSRMRKQHLTSLNQTAFLFGSTAILYGCGEPVIEARIYEDFNECLKHHPKHSETCQFNYQEARRIADYTAPRYKSAYDCASEFKNCIPGNKQDENWFRPEMAGFLLAEGLDEDDYGYPCPAGTYLAYDECQYPEPVFKGTGQLSESGYYRSDGSWYYWSSGNNLRKPLPIRLNSKVFSQPARAAVKGLSRGGFGSYSKSHSSYASAASRGSRSGGRGRGGS